MNNSEIQLEKIKLAFLQKVSRELLDASVETGFSGDDFVKNLTTIKIQGYLWGESGIPRLIEYPLTWWDAFKDRWFPDWLLCKYPARFQQHEISMKTIYPNFRISMKNEPHVLKFELQDRVTVHE